MEMRKLLRSPSENKIENVGSAYYKGVLMERGH